MAINPKAPELVKKIVVVEWQLYDISEKGWYVFETTHIADNLMAKVVKAIGAKEWTIEPTTGLTPLYKGKPVLWICLR